MPAPEHGENNSFLLPSHPHWTKSILLPVTVNPVASNPVLGINCNGSSTTSEALNPESVLPIFFYKPFVIKSGITSLSLQKFIKTSS